MVLWGYRIGLVNFKQRFYMVPLDADCSNSNVKHNFKIDGWKDWDFSQRNLVKLSGGKLFCYEKGRNERAKTNLSPEWVPKCLPSYHSQRRETQFAGAFFSVPNKFDIYL